MNPSELQSKTVASDPQTSATHTQMSAPESQVTPPMTSAPLNTLAAVGTLDDTIHQKVRLSIMSTLLALGEADFKLLKETLALSDGNLSTHLTLLEERGYLLARKEFVRRKPHTTYTPTPQGREAFQRYLLTLEQIVRASGGLQSDRDALNSPAANFSMQALPQT